MSSNPESSDSTGSNRSGRRGREDQRSSSGELQQISSSTNPRDIELSPYLLRYYDKKTSELLNDLNDLFARSNAHNYTDFVLLSTVVFLIVNVGLVVYDLSRFDGNQLLLALLIRFCGIVPLTLIILGFILTSFYKPYSQVLALPGLLIGWCTIAYAIIGEDPSYGTLALLIVYLYSFSPVDFFYSTGVCVTLTLSYVIAFYASDLQREASTVAVFGELFGTLALFILVIGFIGYTLEFSQRLAYLNRFRIIVDQQILKGERKMYDQLLASMLPEDILKRLKKGERLIADEYQEVTIVFCRICDFDAYSARMSPAKVVQLLNVVFSAFDQLVDKAGVHKVETVAEEYLVAAGCPKRTRLHAERAAEMAIGMQRAMPIIRELVKQQFDPHTAKGLRIKIGINSGRVMAGVVGTRNPRFKLFGDAVNTSSRMMASCLPGRIQVNLSTYRILKESGVYRYALMPRNGVPIKGKGWMHTFWLLGREQFFDRDGVPRLYETPDRITNAMLATIDQWDYRQIRRTRRYDGKSIAALRILLMQRYYAQLQKAASEQDQSPMAMTGRTDTNEDGSAQYALTESEVLLEDQDDEEEVEEHRRRFELTLLDRARLDLAARGEDGHSILYGPRYDEGGEDSLPLQGGACGGLGLVENGREGEENLLAVLEYEAPKGNDHDKVQHQFDAMRAIAYAGVSATGAQSTLGRCFVDKYGMPCDDERQAKGLNDASGDGADDEDQPQIANFVRQMLAEGEEDGEEQQGGPGAQEQEIGPASATDPPTAQRLRSTATTGTDATLASAGGESGSRRGGSPAKRLRSVPSLGSMTKRDQALVEGLYGKGADDAVHAGSQAAASEERAGGLGGAVSGAPSPIGTAADSVLSERLEGDSQLGSPAVRRAAGALEQSMARRPFGPDAGARSSAGARSDGNGNGGERLQWDPLNQLVQVSQILDPGLSVVNRRELQRDIVQRTMLGGSDRHMTGGSRTQARREEQDLARLIGGGRSSDALAVQLSGMLGLDQPQSDPLTRKDSAGPGLTTSSPSGGPGRAVVPFANRQGTDATIGDDLVDEEVADDEDEDEAVGLTGDAKRGAGARQRGVVRVPGAGGTMALLRNPSFTVMLGGQISASAWTGDNGSAAGAGSYRPGGLDTIQEGPSGAGEQGGSKEGTFQDVLRNISSSQVKAKAGATGDTGHGHGSGSGSVAASGSAASSGAAPGAQQARERQAARLKRIVQVLMALQTTLGEGGSAAGDPVVGKGESAGRGVSLAGSRAGDGGSAQGKFDEAVGTDGAASGAIILKDPAGVMTPAREALFTNLKAAILSSKPSGSDGIAVHSALAPLLYSGNPSELSASGKNKSKGKDANAASNAAPADPLRSTTPVMVLSPRPKRIASQPGGLIAAGSLQAAAASGDVAAMLVSEPRGSSSKLSKLSQTARKARAAVIGHIRKQRVSAAFQRQRANTTDPRAGGAQGGEMTLAQSRRRAPTSDDAGMAAGGRGAVHQDLQAHAQAPLPGSTGGRASLRGRQGVQHNPQSPSGAQGAGSTRTTSGGLFHTSSGGTGQQSDPTAHLEANSVTSDALAAWIDAENNEGSMRSHGSFSDDSDVHEDGDRSRGGASPGGRSYSGALTPATPSPVAAGGGDPEPKFAPVRLPVSGASPRVGTPPQTPRRSRLNRPRGHTADPKRAGIGIGGAPPSKPASLPRPGVGTPPQWADRSGASGKRPGSGKKVSGGVAARRQRRRSVTTMGYSTRQLGLGELQKRRMVRFDGPAHKGKGAKLGLGGELKMSGASASTAHGLDSGGAATGGAATGSSSADGPSSAQTGQGQSPSSAPASKGSDESGRTRTGAAARGSSAGAASAVGANSAAGGGNGSKQGSPGPNSPSRRGSPRRSRIHDPGAAGHYGEEDSSAIAKYKTIKLPGEPVHHPSGSLHHLPQGMGVVRQTQTSSRRKEIRRRRGRPGRGTSGSHGGRAKKPKGAGQNGAGAAQNEENVMLKAQALKAVKALEGRRLFDDKQDKRNAQKFQRAAEKLKELYNAAVGIGAGVEDGEPGAEEGDEEGSQHSMVMSTRHIGAGMDELIGDGPTDLTPAHASRSLSVQPPRHGHKNPQGGGAALRSAGAGGAFRRVRVPVGVIEARAPAKVPKKYKKYPGLFSDATDHTMDPITMPLEPDTERWPFRNPNTGAPVSVEPPPLMKEIERSRYTRAIAATRAISFAQNENPAAGDAAQAAFEAAAAAEAANSEGRERGKGKSRSRRARSSGPRRTRRNSVLAVQAPAGFRVSTAVTDNGPMRRPRSRSAKSYFHLLRLRRLALLEGRAVPRPVRPFTPPLPPAPDEDAANGIAAKNGSKAKKEEGRDLVEARAILVTLQGLDCRDVWQVLGPAGALDLLERTCDDLELGNEYPDPEAEAAAGSGGVGGKGVGNACGGGAAASSAGNALVPVRTGAGIDAKARAASRKDGGGYLHTASPAVGSGSQGSSHGSRGLEVEKHSLRQTHSFQTKNGTTTSRGKQGERMRRSSVGAEVSGAQAAAIEMSMPQRVSSRGGGAAGSSGTQHASEATAPGAAVTPRHDGAGASQEPRSPAPRVRTVDVDSSLAGAEGGSSQGVVVVRSAGGQEGHSRQEGAGGAQPGHRMAGAERVHAASTDLAGGSASVRVSFSGDEQHHAAGAVPRLQGVGDAPTDDDLLHAANAGALASSVGKDVAQPPGAMDGEDEGGPESPRAGQGRGGGHDHDTRRRRKKLDTVVVKRRQYCAVCFHSVDGALCGQQCVGERTRGEDAGTVLERMYHEEHKDTWRRFAYWSALLAIAVLVIFALYDFILYGRDDPGDNCLQIWTNLSILRYAVMLPIALIYVGMSHLEAYQSSLHVAEGTTATGMFLIGLCIVAISLLGQQPGYGILALYVVFALNVSLVAMFYRCLVLFLAVVAYLVLIPALTESLRNRDAESECQAAGNTNQTAYDACLADPPSHPDDGSVGDICRCDVSTEDTLEGECKQCLVQNCSAFEPIQFQKIVTDGIYLFVFFIGQAIPVLTREMSLRLNFFRSIQMDHARQKVTKEQERNRRLLHNLLPPSVAEKLLDGHQVADTVQSCSILFTDLKGFTQFASKIRPEELLTFLNQLYSRFDELTSLFGVAKIELIGDAYFGVSGCPEPDEGHAERAVNAGLEMVRYMPTVREISGEPIRMRVGVHSGGLIAGVVGSKDPRYHLFGQSVTTAMEHESQGVPDCVHVSNEAMQRMIKRQAQRTKTLVKMLLTHGKTRLRLTKACEQSVEQWLQEVPGDAVALDELPMWYGVAAGKTKEGVHGLDGLASILSPDRDRDGDGVGDSPPPGVRRNETGMSSASVPPIESTGPSARGTTAPSSLLPAPNTLQPASTAGAAAGASTPGSGSVVARSAAGARDSLSSVRTRQGLAVTTSFLVQEAAAAHMGLALPQQEQLERIAKASADGHGLPPFALRGFSSQRVYLHCVQIAATALTGLRVALRAASDAELAEILGPDGGFFVFHPGPGLQAEVPVGGGASGSGQGTGEGEGKPAETKSVRLPSFIVGQGLPHLPPVLMRAVMKLGRRHQQAGLL